MSHFIQMRYFLDSTFLPSNNGKISNAIICFALNVIKHVYHIYNVGTIGLPFWVFDHNQD
jgi:hypothetical protein